MGDGGKWAGVIEKNIGSAKRSSVLERGHVEYEKQPQKVSAVS